MRDADAMTMMPKHLILLCAVVGMFFGVFAGAGVAILRGSGQPQKGSTGVVPVEDALELSRQVMVYRTEVESWKNALYERDTMWGNRIVDLKAELNESKRREKNAELEAWKKVKAELEGAGVMKR